MIKIIPYSTEHMDLFEQRECDVARYGKLDSDYSNPFAEHGVAFTAVEDGRILIVGGIMHFTENTGRCWTLVSKYAENRGVALVRVTKSKLESLMETMHLHRVETCNIADAEDHHKWCRLLGFTFEGIMRCYDDQKRDYHRYAKFRGCSHGN